MTQTKQQRRGQRFRSVILAGLLSITTSGGSLVVTETPVDADHPVNCYWLPGQMGTKSNCDGKLFWNDLSDMCHYLQEPVRSAPIRSSAGTTGGEIELWYSPECRVVDAFVVHDLGPSASCYAKVARLTDGGTDQRAERGNPTPVLYNSGETSYAWGYCRVGAVVYTGRTANYSTPPAT